METFFNAKNKYFCQLKDVNYLFLLQNVILYCARVFDVVLAVLLVRRKNRGGTGDGNEKAPRKLPPCHAAWVLPPLNVDVSNRALRALRALRESIRASEQISVKTCAD